MPEENTRLDELKKMKAGVQSSPSSRNSSGNRSSLPAWLWWGMGILLGCISIFVLSANYSSIKALSVRYDAVERKEASLLDYETRLLGLKEEAAALTTQRDALKETVDNLQADIKAGTAVIADYRIMKEESDKLGSEVIALHEQRKQAIDDKKQLDVQVVALRAEHASLLDSATNKFSSLNQIQTAIAAADKSLKATEGLLAQKKQDLSGAEQALQLAESKRIQAEANLGKVLSQQEQLESKVKLLKGQQTELTGVPAELLSAKTEKQLLERNVAALKGEVGAYEATKEQLSQAKRELARVQEDLASATSRSEALGQQLEKLRAEVKALERDCVELKTEIAADEVARKNLSRVKDDLSDAEALLVGRQKEISIAEQQLAELKKKISVAEAEVQAAKQQPSSITSDVTTASGEGSN